MAATKYPYDAFMLIAQGEEISTRPFKPPVNAADAVEAYADSIFEDEKAAKVAWDKLTLGETEGFDVTLEAVTIHEDGFIGLESEEITRAEVFAAWGMTDEHAPATPAA